MSAEVTFREREALQLLLVKAVEEEHPAAFDAETLAKAGFAAANGANDSEILEKRAALLFFELPRPLKSLERIALLPEDWVGWGLAGSFLVGLSSNYLGRSGQVHVVYNPIVLLLLWNIAVFAMLLWSRRLSRTLPFGRRNSDSGSPSHTAVADERRGEQHPEPSLLLRASRLLLPDLWARYHEWRLRLRARRAGVENAGRIVSAFFEDYFNTAGSVFAARAKCLVHLCAIGLVVGAVAGIYLRGLFFEYQAVWRSTFIDDPSTISLILNVLLLPSWLILDGEPIPVASIQGLLQPEGAAAAPWLHKLALAAFLVVCVPRAVLAALSSRHTRKAADRIKIDLATPYFTQTLSSVKAGHLERLRESVATEIRREIAKLAESIALFVRDRFFDCYVLPTLITFRNAGGRVADLEVTIETHKTAFQPELSSHLSEAQGDFERSLQERLRSAVGRELSPIRTVMSRPLSGSGDPVGVTDSVAGGLSDAIGVSVTAAVSAAVATISGGIGNTLGVAILSTLLGTSGPIGLLLGALVGLAVGGAAFWLGREQLKAAVKTWKLPAAVVKLALRDARLQDTRTKIYESVKGEIERELDPIVPQIVSDLVGHLTASLGGGEVSKPHQAEGTER